jgi:hypothetical protein
VERQVGGGGGGSHPHHRQDFQEDHPDDVEDYSILLDPHADDDYSLHTISFDGSNASSPLLYSWKSDPSSNVALHLRRARSHLPSSKNWILQERANIVDAYSGGRIRDPTPTTVSELHKPLYVYTLKEVRQKEDVTQQEYLILIITCRTYEVSKASPTRTASLTLSSLLCLFTVFNYRESYVHERNPIIRLINNIFICSIFFKVASSSLDSPTKLIRIYKPNYLTDTELFC